LALRDGRQQNREEIILIDPGKDATEWMKMKIGQALRHAANQDVTWRVIELPEELAERDGGDFGIWICLIAMTLAAVLTVHPNFSLQERTLKINGMTTDFERIGRETISKSIQSGGIPNAQGQPFCSLRLVKKRKTT